jgi:hypothetical protein
MKYKFGACDMQPAAVAARSMGVMQQAASAACIIYNFLHATEQHCACDPKRRRTAQSEHTFAGAYDMLVIFL